MNQEEKEFLETEFIRESNEIVEKFRTDFGNLLTTCSHLYDKDFLVHVKIDGAKMSNVSVKKKSPSGRWVRFI